MGSAIHVEAVKMQRGRLISQRILDVDHKLIANVGDNGWDGPLPVDAHDRTCLLAIWIRVHPTDVEVVGDGRSVGDGGEERYRHEKARQREGHDSRCVPLASSVDVDTEHLLSTTATPRGV